eukprot:TRINITY_DN797_c0_g1_i1.p1 TRINITY_DN797_c0_g1~~TRINITY_DN797_c0_g1_i1.p1  ORF type:complete len:780 (+),score=153.48 TRINITY_DN797_c0_g1_i1:60-2342(+)
MVEESEKKFVSKTPVGGPEVGYTMCGLAGVGGKVVLVGANQNSKLEVFQWEGEWKKTRPGAVDGRVCHAVAPLDTHVYIHGGWRHGFQYQMWDALYDSVCECDDMLRYSVADDSWEVMQTKNAPRGRAAHTLIPHTADLILFGGMCCTNGHFEGLNDLWKFHTPTSTWRALTPKGEPPSPRGMHSAAMQNNMLYIFGGYKQSKNQRTGLRRDYVLTDLHCLCMATNIWRSVTCFGTPPSVWSEVARAYHPPPAARPMSACNGSLYVYDPGQPRCSTSSPNLKPAAPTLGDALEMDGERPYSELYVLNLATMEWCSGGLTPYSSPDQLGAGTSCIYNKQLVIFGGAEVATGRHVYDIHTIDLKIVERPASELPEYEKDGYYPYVMGCKVPPPSPTGTNKATDSSGEMEQELENLLAGVSLTLKEVARYSDVDVDELLRIELGLTVVRRNKMKDIIRKKRTLDKPAWDLQLDDGKAINIDEINFSSLIGKGHFGSVWAGTWRLHDVAVKELTREPEGVKSELLEEISSLWRLRHPNIVTCMGHAVRLDGKVLLVTELCGGGSLEKYLNTLSGSGGFIDVREFLRIAADSSSAMYYLQCERRLHRDLATRNIFRTNSGVHKVGDFGLSRVLTPETSSFIQSKDPKERFPLCWTSPESIRTLSWDVASDVWSFGLVLWECLVYAQYQPFRSHFNNPRNAILEGKLPPRPPSCPAVLWDTLITPCWKPAAERPMFDAVLKTVRGLEGKLSDTALAHLVQHPLPSF